MIPNAGNIAAVAPTVAKAGVPVVVEVDHLPGIAVEEEKEAAADLPADAGIQMNEEAMMAMITTTEGSTATVPEMVVVTDILADATTTTTDAVLPPLLTTG